METIQTPKKHSKLGIAGCLIALFVWLYFAIVFVLTFYTDWFTGLLSDTFVPESRGISDLRGLGVAVVVFTVIFFFIPVIGHLIGLIISFIGLFIPSNKRLFPAIGIFLNLLPGLVLLILYIVGGLSVPA